jgi:hypothetical protein
MVHTRMSKRIEEKRFSRAEVELIVRRTAELQARAPSVERVPEGASLAEIETLAQQLGIDSAGVRTAALELHRPKKPSLGRLVWGAPFRARLRRVVPRAIDKEAFEPLLLAIQREMDDVGNVALVGNTLTWTVSGPRPIRRSITLSSSDGRTIATLEMQAAQLAGGLFCGIGGGLGGSAGVNALVWAIIRHSPGLGVLTAAVFLGSYLFPRFIFSRVMAAQIRRGEEMLDRLTAQIERQ